MKRTDIRKIMLIGAGPIAIGQGCEFDYSGTQACKALKKEGYEVVLVNSNPATIMTDPEFADRTYVEPLTPDILHEIIRRERPDALLPTLGGQTALNLAMELHKRGVLQRCRVELIGASAEAINKAEDRQLFKQTMQEIGLDLPRSGSAHSLAEAQAVARAIGEYPLVIRPGFTLGGTGGGIARDEKEFEAIVTRGLAASLNTEVLIEESLVGWKEFEMEVMRDKTGNAVIVCSIENLDPMGVHTGDSITIAPIQTLTDREYQAMRADSLAVMEAIGVETGGSNVQWAVDPATGRRIIIEMNPRVSRSSALASKATGYPIAKIAALLAVGCTLDELPNDITRATPASFEPALDYVVTKIPRFTFEKFPAADSTLGTQMKSIGEAMAIGRNIKQSLQKAFRSLETGRAGFGADGKDAKYETASDAELRAELIRPNAERLYYLRAAFKRGWSEDELHALTRIDRYFLRHLAELAAFEDEIKSVGGLGGIGGIAALERDAPLFRQAKEFGYSDRQIAYLLGATEQEIRTARCRLGIRPEYATVDTCAGEFEAVTPYYYSCYSDMGTGDWGLGNGEDEGSGEDAASAHNCSSGAVRRKPRRQALPAEPCAPLTLPPTPPIPQERNAALPAHSAGTTATPPSREPFAAADALGAPTSSSAPAPVAECAPCHDAPQSAFVSRSTSAFASRSTVAAPFAAADEDVGAPSAAAAANSTLLPPHSTLKIMVLGGGPNRIGQGIEFDYCCCHAAFALRAAGHKVVMVNSNPETVSTDYDTSDKLYFEPLTLEDIMHVYEHERCAGVIVQFGGQTPLNLAQQLRAAGANIIGTSPDDIDAAEDRDTFQRLAASIGIRQPESGIAHNAEEAADIAERIGYPLLVRPSFVLGGRGMVIVYKEKYLRKFVDEAAAVADGKPILIDRFLEDAIELDVDCISDGATTIIGAILEHIEPAGIHSGDSASVMPPPTLSAAVQDKVRAYAKAFAKELRVCGLMNMQLAVKDGEIYIIEVNPRASRTIPFVSKAIGVPLAGLAARCMAGETLASLGLTRETPAPCTAVKEAVFPFAKFPGVDIVLTPEMKSTGEVMSLDPSPGLSYLKSQLAAGNKLPSTGNVFISLRDEDKQKAIPLAKQLIALGYELYATRGTSTLLCDAGIKTRAVFRISRGRPNLLDLAQSGEIQWIINTAETGAEAMVDEIQMRAQSVISGIPITTTLAGFAAALEGLAEKAEFGRFEVCSLQEHHHRIRGAWNAPVAG